MFSCTVSVRLSKLRGWRLLLAIAGLAILVVLVLYVLPALLAGPNDELTTAERLKAENDVRATLIQGLGGAALLAGLYFTARTFQVNREAQATERFTRAIDQLGNEKADVRLGGIYALERIAQGSKADYRPIMEVLATFVREHARWRPTPEDAKRPGVWMTYTEDHRVWVPDPRPDVQAALSVLARRNREHDAPGHQFDFSDLDLRGHEFGGAHFEGARFRGSHLEGASLRGAHLEGAYFDGTHLDFARLDDAHLDGAFFNYAHLEDTTLNGAHLDGVTIQLGTLKRIHFGAHPLGDVRLSNVDLGESGLTIFHLEGARININNVVLPRVPAGVSVTKILLGPESDWARLHVTRSAE
jgi:hypothetical protein